MKEKILGLPRELFENRRLIFSLARNDFKTRYAGSYLGIIWAFVQPVITVLVYWFVFEVGFKTPSPGTYPFLLYLVAGIVPWFFFSDALNGGTNALLEYSYLVKKVVFKISVLPIVKIISALFVHVFFTIFTIFLCSLYGYWPSIYTLQIFYYVICVFVFTLGLAYATSAIVIFFRDLTQIIGIALQVGIWLTPIMWKIEQMENHPVVLNIIKLNPLYYVVTGYRDAILDKIWFWERWQLGLYFWGITIMLFAGGALIFKRLKVHFADVL